MTSNATINRKRKNVKSFSFPQDMEMGSLNISHKKNAWLIDNLLLDLQPHQSPQMLLINTTAIVYLFISRLEMTEGLEKNVRVFRVGSRGLLTQ